MPAHKSLTAHKAPKNQGGREAEPQKSMNFGKYGDHTQRVESQRSSRVGRLKLTPLNTGHREDQVRRYYQTLYAAWGPQHWWPARTRFEVIVGAYLIQNTSWKNVEAALRNLRNFDALSLRAIRQIAIAELERLIRPAGYFRQKAARLKTFVAFVDRRYGGSLSRMFAQPTGKLRQQLLELNGVGPETADSILLYAGQREVFVVDAYARRILDRHAILPQNAAYEEIRSLFERALSGKITMPPLAVPVQPVAAHEPSPVSSLQRSPAAQLYNDMHGLIVAVGKRFCLKSRPHCDGCPLQEFLP
jgi:endonuclease III related protein